MPFTLPLNSKAVSFNLKATDGKSYHYEELKGERGTVVFFTCNHCPYVTGSDEDTKRIAQKFIPEGITFIAINSNSPNTYQEDSYEHMITRMEGHQFPWTYLHDETQEVAKKYGALRTPHFYLFNAEDELIYCGRAIDQPRNFELSTSHELEEALNEHLEGKEISIPLTNPIGCNVKWDGKDAHWMPVEACDIV